MNWETVILAIVAGLPATIAAIAALIQASKAKNQATETHRAVNSRMTELLEITRKQAGNEATLIEKNAESARKGEAAAAIASTSVPLVGIVPVGKVPDGKAE